MLKELTDLNFDQETFESSKPVLVFFGAERCSVCKELLPTVEELADDYSGKIKFFWVEVDRYKTLFRRFRLRGIPTLILFREGAAKDRTGGLRSKEELVEMIENHIS